MLPRVWGYRQLLTVYNTCIRLVTAWQQSLGWRLNHVTVTRLSLALWRQRAGFQSHLSSHWQQSCYSVLHSARHTYNIVWFSNKLSTANSISLFLFYSGLPSVLIHSTTPVLCLNVDLSTINLYLVRSGLRASKKCCIQRHYIIWMSFRLNSSVFVSILKCCNQDLYVNVFRLCRH